MVGACAPSLLALVSSLSCFSSYGASVFCLSLKVLHQTRLISIPKGAATAVIIRSVPPSSVFLIRGAALMLACSVIF